VTRVRAACIAALLALAACGSEAQQQEDTAPPAAEAQATPVIEAPATPLVAAPEPRVIPVQFLGVWDAQTGTCDPASDLRLDIGEDAITFYESVGTVESVREDDGTTLVTLAMAGEGERWTQTLGLRFFDARTSLMIIDPERPGDAERFMRKRCPD
jgi:hypothetical protein